MFVFLVFRKIGIIKSCPSSDDLSAYTISWSCVDWCKFRIHLRNLNVCQFGMAEGTTLKCTASRSLSSTRPS